MTVTFFPCFWFDLPHWFIRTPIGSMKKNFNLLFKDVQFHDVIQISNTTICHTLRAFLSLHFSLPPSIRLPRWCFIPSRLLSISSCSLLPSSLLLSLMNILQGSRDGALLLSHCQTPAWISLLFSTHHLQTIASKQKRRREKEREIDR